MNPPRTIHVIVSKHNERSPSQSKRLVDSFPPHFTSKYELVRSLSPEWHKHILGAHWTRNSLGANNIWRIKAAKNFIGATWSLARRGPVALLFVEVNGFPQVHHAHCFVQRSFGAALRHAVMGSQHLMNNLHTFWRGFIRIMRNDFMTGVQNTQSHKGRIWTYKDKTPFNPKVKVNQSWDVTSNMTYGYVSKLGTD